MNNQSLKSFAWACKVLAIVGSVVVPLWILHPRWGVNRIADLQTIGLAVLSLIPNRWLAFSRTSFVTFLPLMLFPFRDFFRISTFSDLDLGSVLGGTIVLSFFFVPLPLSLVLSRVRFLRGDKFTYA